MLAPAIMVTFIAADADGARFVEVRKPLRMVRLQRSLAPVDHERSRVNVNTTDATALLLPARDDGFIRLAAFTESMVGHA